VIEEGTAEESETGGERRHLTDGQDTAAFERRPTEDGDEDDSDEEYVYDEDEVVTEDGGGNTADTTEGDNVEEEDTIQYGAQYPYRHTTSDEYTGSYTDPRPGVGHDDRYGVDRVERRRTVVTGTGSGTSYNTQTQYQNGQSGYDTDRQRVSSSGHSTQYENADRVRGLGLPVGYQRTQNSTAGSQVYGPERRRTVVTGTGSGTSYNTQPQYQNGQSGYDTDRQRVSSSGHSTQYENVDRQRGLGLPVGYQRTQNSTAGSQVYGPYIGVPTTGDNQYQFTDRSSEYQSSRPEQRGPRYTGPRYVDNHGHYVDQYGRHLDSTGQFYDISGRYQDAIMTRTQTTTYTGGSGTGSGTSQSGYRTQGGSDASGYRTQGGSDLSGYRTQGGSDLTSSRYQTGGSSGSRYPSSGGEFEVDRSQSRPVNSYGGTQFYSGGTTYRTTYDPIVSQISSDPVSITIL